MNTKKTLTVFLFAFFLLPLMAISATIERYCFVDSSGSLYDFRGGKLGKKAYTVQISNVFCPAVPLTGVATFAKITGGYLITAIINRDVAASCVSYQQSIAIDVNLLSGAGNFDNFPRNSPPDGSETYTRTACPGLFKPTPPDSPKSNVGAGKANQE